jgi:hypothetical protein
MFINSRLGSEKVKQLESFIGRLFFFRHNLLETWNTTLTICGPGASALSLFLESIVPWNYVFHGYESILQRLDGRIKLGIIHWSKLNRQVWDACVSFYRLNEMIHDPTRATRDSKTQEVVVKICCGIAAPQIPHLFSSLLYHEALDVNLDTTLVEVKELTIFKFTNVSKPECFPPRLNLCSIREKASVILKCVQAYHERSHLPQGRKCI